MAQKFYGAVGGGGPITLSTLSDSGVLFYGKCVGRINQFIMMGGMNDNATEVRWCAIGDATDWPVPGTDDARAKQAGQQSVPPDYGEVTAIAGGDFFGYIFQERAITKAQYIGGDVVFSFDTFEEDRGCKAPGRMAQVDDKIFFQSVKGYHMVENGVVTDIGYGVLDDSYYSVVSGSAGAEDRQYNVAINKDRGLVFFEDATNPLCYNYKTNQWTRIPAYADIQFFDVDDKDGIIGIQRRSGTAIDLQYPSASDVAQTATITTGEADINQGGRAVVTGVRPLITGGTTTVRVGKRDTLAGVSGTVTSVTWSTSTSLNSRTKFANFREEARYHRAEFSITGGFTQAMGADVEFTKSGKV